MSLTKIALIGATGSVGTNVLNALEAEPGFKTTVIARPSSSIIHSRPNGVDIVTVSFDDHAALVEALTGFDALVLTVGAPGLNDQIAIIDAAAEAGVKRIIPSEFGSDLDNALTGGLGVFAGKIQVRKQLERLAKEGKTTWTGISNGSLLDWGIGRNFLGIDPKTNTATLFDGGDHYFSATLLSDVAKGVVGVLHDPKDTKNKLIYIQSTRLTQKQLVTIYEKVLDVKLETIVVSTDDIKQSGDEKIAKGDFSGFVDHIVKAIWGKLSGGDFNGKHTSEKFGIHQLTLEELEEVVRANIPK